MEQICNLETVKLQEIPNNVFVIFYDIEICYQSCGEKKSFLESFNIPKCIVIGSSMVEGLFSLLFYYEGGINQYAVQKTLTVGFRASLLLFEVGCLRYVVLPYHLRMLLSVFMRISKSFV